MSVNKATIDGLTPATFEMARRHFCNVVDNDMTVIPTVADAEEQEFYVGLQNWYERSTHDDSVVPDPAYHHLVDQEQCGVINIGDKYHCDVVSFLFLFTDVLFLVHRRYSKIDKFELILMSFFRVDDMLMRLPN